MLLEPKKFEFNEFLLDAKEKILQRGGKSLPITPKAFQLLLVLVENHGCLIEKAELMDAVWADSFVEETNLAFTIGLLRKALNDDAHKPQFIETVPKRGYRFIADVKFVEREDAEDSKFELIDNSAAAENGKTSSPSKSPHRVNETENQSSATILVPADLRSDASDDKSGEATDFLRFTAEINKNTIAETKRRGNSFGRKKTTVLIGIIVLSAGAIALGYYLLAQNKVAVSVKKSIAVLPFKPVNAANRDELYEIGIADSLILRLSSMKDVVVRPLSATRSYADIVQDPLVAGKEQQVDYILASNYQLAGGRIKITAQLFNVANGQIEETYKGEKDAGDIFAMQDEIAGEIGNVLLKRFVTTSNGPTAKRGTTNEEAYRLYLQGMYLFEKRNLADAHKAVEVLEQAVRLDPNYALAWAGKAHAHRSVANLGRKTNVQEEYQNSIDAINKAMALDENLTDAHSAMCDNKMYYEYDFAGAERECKRAIELDPNSSLAHQIYARYLNSRGRPDEAIAEIKTAIDIEPASLFHQRVYGTCLYFARRYSEAVTQFKRVAVMDENYRGTYFFLIPTFEMQEDHSEAFNWFMKWLAIQKADEETVNSFRAAFQAYGWQGVLRERVKRFEKSDEPYFQGAAYYAQLGDKDRAFEYLENSYQRHELWMANLRVDPLLDPLRDDPRFEALVTRVESK